MTRYKKNKKKSFIEVYKEIYPDNGKEIKSVTFQVTEDCCLKCTYCYQTNKSRNKMNFETAKKFIDSMLNNEYSCLTTENTGGLLIDFIGGEPTMEIELIQNIIEYLMGKMIEMNHPWKNYTAFGMCSNGILVDTPKVQEFFEKYHDICELAISIDGNKELHDMCRLDFNGNGSYDRAMKAAKNFKEMYGYIPDTKMTLSPYNVSYTKDAVINLINEGYTEIHLNCQFEDVWDISHARILYSQLKELSDYIIENKLYDKVLISMFEEDNFRPVSPDCNENWCGGACEKMIAINHIGNLYPCLRYMESSLDDKQEPIVLGNVNRGYVISESDISAQKKILNVTRRSQSTDECFNCPIAQGCSWCSAFNYQETGSVNKRVTHICVMHKATALANVYYWNKLYEHLGMEKVFVNHVNDSDIDDIIIQNGDDDNGRQFVCRFKSN